MSSDSLKAYTRHRETITVFDHDPQDPSVGHGETCIRNCKPVDILHSDSWDDDEGNPVTDPETIAKIRVAEMRQGVA